MLTIKPEEHPVPYVHSYLLGSVAPRPIAFASTIDKDGNRNLAPFSFFNAFGANPPIAVFSPARRVQGNTTKHTLENSLEVDEVVINIVSYDITHQMVLASSDYEQGVDEFKRTGLTPVASERVKPFRVKESPVQLECKVREVKALGKDGGAGNLIIAEIVMMHVREDILDENKRIDPYKLDPVARLGGRWYSRARGNLFEVLNPQGKDNIGVDGLPGHIRLSHVLSGNDLARLAKIPALPTKDEINRFKKTAAHTLSACSYDSGKTDTYKLHTTARDWIENGKTEDALKLLLAG